VVDRDQNRAGERVAHGDAQEQAEDGNSDHQSDRPGAGAVNGFERGLAGIVPNDLAIFRGVVQVVGGVLEGGGGGFGVLAIGSGPGGGDGFLQRFVKLFGSFGNAGELGASLGVGAISMAFAAKD
jgi:hypothetical protein